MRLLGGEASMSDLILTVRNPTNNRDLLPLYIDGNGTELAQDWLSALRQEIRRNAQLEKNYCWHGWPETQRNLVYLTDQLTKHTTRVNDFNSTGAWQSAGLASYPLRTNYSPSDVMLPYNDIAHGPLRGGGPDHEVMNLVHNYFENLQGTVENLSPYYKLAPPDIKYSIRQINNLCHEIETLCLSLRKAHYDPEWVRPSQITTFLNAKRYPLNREHRKGFAANGYDRRFAHLYMHWTQIGKTLMEVYRDEHAPVLDAATCDAITHLQYYSGEFDVEWGRDVLYGTHKWHTEEIDGFTEWLRREGYDPDDPNLSLGYLEIGRVDLVKSFGTEDVSVIWDMMSSRLDIYSLRVGDDTAVYDYSWADPNHEEKQIQNLMPGYLSHA
jgi:hypothetical protein